VIKSIAVLTLLFAVPGSFALAQQPPSAPEKIVKVELYSPWESVGGKVQYSGRLFSRRCLDLVSLEQRCGGQVALSYGNRFGENWDIFAVDARDDSQTRMVDLGLLDWTDSFEVPWIQPWAKLRSGEQRNVAVNTSGSDGASGAPGMNGDGTSPRPKKSKPRSEGYADKPVAKQVSSVVQTEEGRNWSDNYTPFTQITKGHIYAVRVLDPQNAFYILIRVDDVIRGTKAAISFKKVDGPKKPVF
jgi:hypothetical protein